MLKVEVIFVVEEEGIPIILPGSEEATPQKLRFLAQKPPSHIFSSAVGETQDIMGDMVPSPLLHMLHSESLIIDMLSTGQ